MERLGNFANKVKTKSVVILFIFVLVFMQYFYYANIKKQMVVAQKNNIKASQENVPDGYVGIYTVDDLEALNGAGTKTKYILMNDIDIDGKEFSVIENFRGLFDGNYHKISNLKIESQNQYVGMFGRLSGTVQNLILENINVKGDFNGTAYIGGLAGWANPQMAIIQNVHIVGNSNIEASINTTYSYLGGLIGYITSGTISECSTVGKVNTITSGERYAGGLVGYASGTRIEKCNSNAEVANNSDINKDCYLGGLIGKYQGAGNDSMIVVEECNTKGKVVNNSIKVYSCYVGGIIGDVNYYTDTRKSVKNLYSQAIIQVKSAEAVGGIIGTSKINISNCYSNAIIEINIQEGTVSAGGLIGKCYGAENTLVIENSYSSGHILVNKYSYKTYIGGLIGESTVVNLTTNQSKHKTAIKNSYSTINMDIDVYGTSYAYIGGIIGEARSIQITNTYAIGKMDVKNTSTYYSISGVVGQKANNYVTVGRSYWCSETTGASTDAMSSTTLSKTIQEMLSKDTFSGWDFDTIWKIEENEKSLPYLLNIKMPDEVLKENIDYKGFTGEGTKENPILIENIEQLSKINLLTGKEYFLLANDIDASGIGGFNVDGKSFRGILDGNNHKISNLTIKSDDNCVGLFRENQGIIQNLQIENLNIESDYSGAISYIGGIAGYNKGVIKNVEVNGTINNTGNTTVLYMGQIAGYNIEKLENTHTKGTISNNGNIEHLYFGQMVGCNDNTITRANNGGTLRNTGNSTTAYIGGIAGMNNAWVGTASNEGNTIVSNIENIYEGGISGKSRGKIINSYSKGNVNIGGTTAVIGGIVGENSGSVTNTYSIDNIQKNINIETSGGIVGNNGGELISSYYSIENISHDEGKGTEKSLNELKSMATYEEWDFNNVWNIEEDISTPTFKDTYYHYYDDAYWEWHTRFTKDDENYNGEHIIVDSEAVKFSGYDGHSWPKDFLYKKYEYPGEKTFSFILDETKTNFATIDGAGLIFNANKNNDGLSGYILLFRDKEICLYRLNNANFDIESGATISTYAEETIACINKPVATIHKLSIKTSPTNITVIDNGEEILNANLDYSKHVGEDFGLIVSNSNNEFQKSSETWFIKTELEINDYGFPVVKSDMDGKSLKGAKFEVKNELGEVLRQGVTNSNGIFNITKLKEGRYTLQEVKAPEGYILNNTIYSFTVSDEGVITFANEDKEQLLKTETDDEGNIKVTVYNEEEKLIDGHLIINKYKTGTTVPVEGAIIGIYNQDGTPLLGEDGKQITSETNKNGQIELIIKPGTYYFKEIEAPAGYILNDTMYAFTVNNDGSITFANNTNGIIYNSRVTSTAGATKIRKYITGTTTPVEGAVIGLFDKDGNKIVELTTDSNGEISLPSLEVGTYYYKEIEAPAGYVLNDTMYSFTVNNDGSITFGKDTNGIIYNSRVTSTEGATKIRKYITGTTTPVEGAVIGLFDKDGKALVDSDGNQITLTTDANGEIGIPSLEVGTYYYKEIEAPAGYILNDTMYSFTVNNDGSITFGNDTNGIIYNSRVTSTAGATKIKKYITGTTTPVEGAVIGLYNQDRTPLLGKDGNQITLTTNANGEVGIPSLEVGTYYYKEIEAPAGYILNDTMYSFTVNNDGSITFGNDTNGIIYNSRVTSTAGATKIKKYITGTTTLVEGAVIGLFDKDGNKIVELTTDSNGEIGIPSLEVGTYYYKEIEAPAGYVVNNTMYSFTVNNDGSITFANNTNGIIYNSKVTSTAGATKIRKYITGTTTPVEGAVIGLFDKDGNKIVELTTDSNGEVGIPSLEVGTYYYKEIEAPAGYVLNNTMYTFTVNNDGSITFANDTNGIIYNSKVTSTAGATKIKKYITGTTTPVEGAVIGLFDKDGKALVDSDGNQITLTTDSNGEIGIPSLEVGTYYYKEIEAPAGYVLNNTMYSFTVNNDGSITFANDTNGIIYNSRVTSTAGATKIRKYITGTTTPVEGAVIGLFDKDGKALVDSDGNQITLTTDANGEIGIPSLEVGTYYYKEIEAPAGYVLNNTMYSFTVNNDGSITFANDTNGIIYNSRVTSTAGATKIRKYITGTTTPVEGAVIGLYNQDRTPLLGKDGNQITLTTNANGEIGIPSLEVGTYYYKEVEAPAGYVLNDTMYSFTVNNDGSITFANNTNGIIYNSRVTSIAGATKIRKYITGTTTPVEGAVIGLFDKDGNKIVELTTDSNGEIGIPSLEVGTYYYKEVEAPAGYVLNNTMYTFTVNNDGSITFANNTNGIIYNSRVTSIAGATKIRKYITGTTTPVEGAVIGLFDKDGKALVDSDGNQITLTTDANGEIGIPSLEVGTYYYKEIEAPSGYILNNTMYSFTVNNDGSITFANNTNGIIYNSRVTSTEGATKIRKYITGTTTPVEGAVIGLFDKEGNKIVELTTGSNGEIGIPSLEVGTYYYKEIEAPAGYVLNDTIYSFTVNNDGSITFLNNTEGIIYNDKILDGEVEIRKYATGTIDGVPGAVIGIYDENGNPILDENGNQVKFTTNEKGQIKFIIKPGTYRYKEIEAPAGYILNDTMYKFTVSNRGEVVFVENTNGIIYNDKIIHEQIERRSNN